MKIQLVSILLLITLTRAAKIKAPELSIEEVISGSLNLDNTTESIPKMETDVSSGSITKELSQAFSKIISNTPLKQEKLEPSKNEINEALKAEELSNMDVSQNNSETVDEIDDHVSEHVDGVDHVSEHPDEHVDEVDNVDHVSEHGDEHVSEHGDEHVSEHVDEHVSEHVDEHVSEHVDKSQHSQNAEKTHISEIPEQFPTSESHKSQHTEVEHISELKDQETVVDNLESQPVDTDSDIEQVVESKRIFFISNFSFHG